MRFFTKVFFFFMYILKKINKLKPHAVLFVFFASLSNALHPTLNITAEVFNISHSSRNDRNLFNVEFRR